MNLKSQLIIDTYEEERYLDSDERVYLDFLLINPLSTDEIMHIRKVCEIMDRLFHMPLFENFDLIQACYHNDNLVSSTKFFFLLEQTYYKEIEQ